MVSAGRVDVVDIELLVVTPVVGVEGADRSVVGGGFCCRAVALVVA